jgi:intracellular multiplication protein IcmP
MAWMTSKIGIHHFIDLSQQIVRLAGALSLVTFRDAFIAVNQASVAYFLLLIPLLLSAWKIHNHVLRKLENLHDYWSLMKLQSLTNPCIVPIVRFTEYWRHHNIERHKNLARSLTPDEFAAKHSLIKKEGDQLALDYIKTNDLFVLQLGEKLNPAKMSEHYKALASIFMTRIVYRGEEGRKKAKVMQDAINDSCDPEKTGKVNDADCTCAFDFSLAAAEFDALFKRDEMQEIAVFFPFEKIFLMELLQQARTDGKLAPSEFLWLKLIDRPLFYALYAVSKTMIAKGYAEGGAAFVQYWGSIAQRNTSYVLGEPVMHEAIAALEKRLFEANMISQRKLMTDREIEREALFGRIPDV